MKNLPLSFLASAAIAVVVLSGCGSEGGKSTAPDVVTTLPPDTLPGDAALNDSHPTVGPHHGELIELGNDEYHAEWLMSPHEHEPSAGHEQVLSVFILDGSAKNVVPIDAPEVTINLTHHRKPQQFKLAARPTETDPEGKSSRFVSSDEDLLEHFQSEEIEARLVAVINGKSYSGKFSHHHQQHEHAGHAHNEGKHPVLE